MFASRVVRVQVCPSASTLLQSFSVFVYFWVAFLHAPYRNNTHRQVLALLIYCLIICLFLIVGVFFDQYSTIYPLTCLLLRLSPPIFHYSQTLTCNQIYLLHVHQHPKNCRRTGFYRPVAYLPSGPPCSPPLAKTNIYASSKISGIKGRDCRVRARACRVAVLRALLVRMR